MINKILKLLRLEKYDNVKVLNTDKKWWFKYFCIKKEEEDHTIKSYPNYWTSEISRLRQ